MDLARAETVRGEELVELFREVRAALEPEGVPVRALGGIGVLLRAGHPHDELAREYEDLDIAAPSRARAQIEQAMAAVGLRGEERFNALQGASRQLWWTDDGTTHVDVFLGEFNMCHRLDLEAGLTIDHDALPAADLLLTKLQVIELNQKDVADAAALLLTHRLAADQAPGTIDERRLGSVLGRDWGFFTTVSENLARLPKAIPPLGGDLEGRLAAMVSDVQERIERAPKSRRFNLRAKVGKRVPWYRTPDSSL